jgi:hypothetical protein
VSIDLENGADDNEKDGPKKRGRPPKSAAVGDLEKDVREQLEELAEWMKARDPEFAQTFLEDVPRMAKFLSTRAGKHENLLRLLKIVFAKDGPLAGLRAFGRTARALASRLPSRREPDAEWPQLGEDGNWYDEHGNVVVPGT